MLRYTYLGNTIEIRLPRSCGHMGYAVDCTYRYDEGKDKYLLSMYLKRVDNPDHFKIDSQEIDTQYVSGEKNTIIDNIRRIVEQACKSRFFDPYIERYEYTYKCFDRGDDLFTKEQISDAL